MIGSDEKEFYNLAAETSDDLEEWIAVLSKAMNLVTDTKSCMKNHTVKIFVLATKMCLTISLHTCVVKVIALNCLLHMIHSCDLSLECFSRYFKSVCYGIC